MPDISYVKSQVDGRPSVFRFQWTLAAGEVGAPISLPLLADRTIQVFGTFNGATVKIEGTLEEEPTTYGTLRDTAGNLLSFTSAGIETIIQVCSRMRPSVTGGDGSTSLTVIIIGRAV